MKGKLGIAVLYVRDVARERRFYSEVVGLPVIEDQSSPTFVMFAAGGETLLAVMDVSRANGPTGAPGSVDLGLEVQEDVDAIWRDWQTKGASLLAEPKDLPFGRAFEAKDPEGHRLTVYRPAR